jgi:hypothetical protein
MSLNVSAISSPFSRANRFTAATSKLANYIAATILLLTRIQMSRDTEREVCTRGEHWPKNATPKNA